MANSRGRSHRDDDWNESHRTRFSSEYQPNRRRGPNRVRPDCNVLGLFAVQLGERVEVNKSGRPTKMTRAEHLVASTLQDTQKASLAEKRKTLEFLAKHGLLGHLEDESEAIAQLQDELAEARASEDRARAYNEINEMDAELSRSDLLSVLEQVEALLTAEPDDEDAEWNRISLLRRAREMRLARAQKCARQANRSSWTGRSEDQIYQDLLDGTEREEEEERQLSDELDERLPLPPRPGGKDCTDLPESDDDLDDAVDLGGGDPDDPGGFYSGMLDH